jgi:hypothetical protein
MMEERSESQVERTMRFVLGLTITCLIPGAASADFRVLEAQYAGGILVVRGNISQPGRTIVLNEKFAEKSDRKGRFVFRIPYLPLGCRVDLVSGTDRISAPVENCDDQRLMPTGTQPN